MPADLVEWLDEQLRSDEEIARAVTLPGPWSLDSEPNGTVWAEGLRQVAGGLYPDDAAHIAVNDPASVLRTIAAHRAILDAYVDSVERRDHWEREGRPDYVTWSKHQVHALDYAVRALASIYSARSGFDEAWALPL